MDKIFYISTYGGCYSRYYISIYWSLRYTWTRGWNADVFHHQGSKNSSIDAHRSCNVNGWTCNAANHSKSSSRAYNNRNNRVGRFRTSFCLFNLSSTNLSSKNDRSHSIFFCRNDDFLYVFKES